MTQQSLLYDAYQLIVPKNLLLVHLLPMNNLMISSHNLPRFLVENLSVPMCVHLLQSTSDSVMFAHPHCMNGRQRQMLTRSKLKEGGTHELINVLQFHRLRLVCCSSLLSSKQNKKENKHLEFRSLWPNFYLTDFFFIGSTGKHLHKAADKINHTLKNSKNPSFVRL